MSDKKKERKEAWQERYLHENELWDKTKEAVERFKLALLSDEAVEATCKKLMDEAAGKDVKKIGWNTMSENTKKCMKTNVKKSISTVINQVEEKVKA